MSYYVNPHKFSCPWYPYAQEFGAPNIKWCEENLCQWISEPANTYSNFAYIVVAILLALVTTKKQADSDLSMFPRLLFFLGLASGFYHASNHYLSQLGDFLLMYLYIFWGMTINLKRMGKINDGNKYYFFGGFTVLFMVLTHFLYLSYLPIQYLIIVATAFFLFSEFQVRHHKSVNYRYLFLGLGFIAAGEVFSIMDLKRIFCNPQDHIIQGHAIWHLLSAIGLGISFFHFAQEIPKKLSPSEFDEDTGEHHVNFDQLQEIERAESTGPDQTEAPLSEPQETEAQTVAGTETEEQKEDSDQLNLFEDLEEKD